MDSLESIIRKHTLKNASDYKLAIPGKIIGKIIADFPDAKKDMKATMKLINEEAKRVNSLSHEEVEKELKDFTFAEKKIEKKQIELEGAARGKVITRFPPEPSGYLHIGHAKAAWLNFESATRYEGKMLLRFDDTNPEKEKQEYVDAIKEGLLWLGIDWEKEAYTSDSMQELYLRCEELFIKHAAYVCTCTPDDVKKGRAEKKACDCSAKDSQENLQFFKKMQQGEVEEGQAIVRFRGSMKSDNSVMRDPTLFRVIKKEHYRQKKKYCAWPSYDFAAPVMDSLDGITHAMRTKEYELRDELYFAILEKLEMRKPALIEFSRLAIKNAPVSKRLISPLIEQKKVTGWDDPRLPTLSALKRRGILPEAIKEFVLSFGISKVESLPGWEKLLSFNRKMLDERCVRRFFTRRPVKVSVTGAPQKEAVLFNHPAKKDMGQRKITTTGTFFIAAKDADAIDTGETFRLKDLYNLTLEEKKQDGIIAKYEGDTGLAAKKVQWVAYETAVSCKVRIPADLLDENGKFQEDSLGEDIGVCEASCKELDVGTVVQLERYGYAVLDKKNDKELKFIFSC